MDIDAKKSQSVLKHPHMLTHMYHTAHCLFASVHSIACNRGPERAEQLQAPLATCCGVNDPDVIRL